MSGQDQRYQHRWEFRRTENDFDSSSDDDSLKPISAGEPKLMKHKLVNSLSSEENAQQTMPSPASLLRGEKENHLSFEEPNRKPNKPGKSRDRKARPKRTTSNNEPSNAASIDLKGYMESLVEEVKIAREDLLTWMRNEMKSSSKNVIISSKSTGAKKGQRQSAKRSKTPRNNPNKSRRKSGTTENCEDGSSGKRSPKINEEVVVPPKEGENVAIVAKPVGKTEKQKGKTSRLSTKKKKIDGTAAVEQTDKTIAAAADSCVTLSTVVPQTQVINSERNPLEDGNVSDDAVEINALNSEVDLSSHHLKFDPRSQLKDGVFAQNGLRNASDYEQNTCPTMGNGNGNGFPFPLAPQGMNGGIGMPNVSSQFGLQYLTQGNRMSGMYREPPLFPNRNHAYMESYGGLNQHLNFNAQQGGVMALQFPDIRRTAFNQGNITSQ